MGCRLGLACNRHADASGRFLHYHEDTLTTKFREARDKAGLSPRITFHSLRQTFATNLARAGPSFKTIQDLLGQSDPDSAKIYVHAFEEEKQRAAEKIQLPKRSVTLGLQPTS
jgi:integrase